MSMVAVLRSISPDELKRCLAEPRFVEGFLECNEGQSAVHSCFLEKSQFAIHILLTGNVWDTDSPVSAVIHGSREIGPRQPAGPIMYLTPEEVRSVASELSLIGREEMAKRYSPERLTKAGVYPNTWNEDADSLTWVLDDYEALVAFYIRAADSGDAVLIHIG